MEQVRFRTWNEKYNFFHYWGFVEPDKFVGPSTFSGIHEQFTNLLDNQGKEIYEGDIISIPDHYDGDCFTKKGNVVVVFCDGSFDGKSINNQSWEGLPFFGMEVVGNIHENKDLLGKGVK